MADVPEPLRARCTNIISEQVAEQGVWQKLSIRYAIADASLLRIYPLIVAAALNAAADDIADYRAGGHSFHAPDQMHPYDEGFEHWLRARAAEASDG
jgi:hypothetical protein